MARSPETMRSRRREYSASIAVTVSIGPVSASSAAYCAIEVTLDVDWLCNLIIAEISASRRKQIAHAPAGHRKGFRERTGDDDIRLRARHAGERIRLLVSVDEVRVALVGHQPDIFRAADFVDFHELIGGHDRAARIAWRIDDQQFCFRRDRARDLLGAQAESVGRIGHHRDRRRAGVLHHIRIADPIRRGDQDFVACLQKAAERVENGVLAAHRHDAFRHRIGRSELRRVPLADRFAQGTNSRRGRVLRAALFQGSNGGLLDVLRRREIRFAGAEIGQVSPLCAEAFRRGQHGGGRRDGNAVYAGS